MARMSKKKGKRGELEVAAILRDAGFNARRGQQYSGSTESPDVVHDIAGVHLEVKRTEVCRLYEFMEQAQRDANGLIPVVVHRQSRREWVAVLPLANFLELIKVAYGTGPGEEASKGSSLFAAASRR